MDSTRLDSPPAEVAACRVLVCPSGFKESLSPGDAADCIEAGVLRAMPKAIVEKAPMVDGGEGFTKVLVQVTGGRLHNIEVIGPVGRPVESHYGFLGGHRSSTAVIEMAAAAGLSLVPYDMRNPTKTTSFGVGQLIAAAVEDGANNILLGCGDSGTCDGGVGMAQALGVRFYDSQDNLVPDAACADQLVDLARVDMSDLLPRLKSVKIDVACNWHNILCGSSGVAKMFGPQKGANEEQVEIMSLAMDRVAVVMGHILAKDISQSPGGGASGGLGAGLQLIGASLHPRFDIIMKFFNLDELMARADVVITAEGGIDYQTPRGKVPAEVARRAKATSIPVIVLAGTIGEQAVVNYEAGIDAFTSIIQSPTTLANAIQDAERLLIEAAESSMRMIMVGWLVRSRTPEKQKSPLKRPGHGLEDTMDVKKGFFEFVPKGLLRATTF